MDKFKSLQPVESIFLIVTEECQLDCPFCYTKYVPQFGDSGNTNIDPGFAAKIIDKLKPKEVVLHGGEPLLHPELIMEIMDRTTVDTEFVLQSNLAFKELSKKQLELLLRFDGYGTSYNVDRFENNRLAEQYWAYNIKFLKSLGLKCGVVVTLTENHMKKESPQQMCDYLLNDVCVDDILLERVSYSVAEIEERTQEIEKIYHDMDLYMTECYKILPRYMNSIYNGVFKSLRYGLPYIKTECSKCTWTLYHNKIKHACPSLDYKNYKLAEKKAKCLVCEYYRYCQGECECMHGLCAFPKVLFDTVKADIMKENPKQFWFYDVMSQSSQSDFTIADIKISEYCDNNCDHCIMAGSLKHTPTDFEAIKETIRKHPKLYDIRLGGGEPLYNEELCNGILDLISSFYNITFCITTNLLYELTETRKKILSRVEVCTSFDLYYHRFKTIKDLVRWYHNCKALIKNGIKLGCFVVIQNSDEAYMARVKQVLCKMGIIEIHFVPCRAGGKAVDFFKDYPAMETPCYHCGELVIDSDGKELQSCYIAGHENCPAFRTEHCIMNG